MVKKCIYCLSPISKNSSKFCLSCYRKTLSENGSKKGKQHFNWKGGISITPWGYMRYNPTHEHGGRFVHVVVMEKHLGRKINSLVEKVHHINHDKLDNRPENLQLMSIADHNRLHKKGAKWKYKVPWKPRPQKRNPLTGRFI